MMQIQSTQHKQQKSASDMVLNQKKSTLVTFLNTYKRLSLDSYNIKYV